MDDVLTFIDAETVRSSLTFKACITAMRDLMPRISSGVTAQLPRQILPLEGKLLGVMAGALSLDGFFGAKILGVTDDVARPGRQSHHGLVILFDARTGRPVCVADAEEITSIRTASASAVATDVLARHDAKSLGIFGCGAQARAHIEAIACVRPLDRVLVWGRSADKTQRFVEEVSAALNLHVRASFEPEAVAACDIVCTVTHASEPILCGKWVPGGTHVNVVGFNPRGHGEVDRDLVLKSRFISDSRASVAREATEFLQVLQTGAIGEDHLVGELGDVLAGTVAGRQSSSEVTLYRSLGHVAQDLAALSTLHLSRSRS